MQESTHPSGHTHRRGNRIAVTVLGVFLAARILLTRNSPERSATSPTWAI